MVAGKHTFTRQSIVPLITFIAFMVGLCFFATYYDNKNRDSFSKNRGFTYGEIIKIVSSGTKGGKENIMWQTIIKGKTYTFYDWINDSVNYDSLFGKKFPVIYDTSLKHYYQINGSQQILVFPCDFHVYHLPYPDSLKWVLKFYKHSNK